MDFVLPANLDALKGLVRRVVRDHCVPLESKYLSASDGGLPPGDASGLRRVSMDTGIYTAHVPEVYGGGGMGALGAVVGDEETARSIVRLPICHVPNILLENASQEQKEKYIAPYLRGEMKACFAQTEPHSGTDLANSMKTSAVLRGGDWVINGTKAFISDSDGSDFLMLQAVTDPKKMVDGGITMFLVDRGLPGVSTSPIRTWMTPVGTNYFVYLDDVRVPRGQVLGELGQGYLLGQQWLNYHDRLMKCSTILGILTRSLDMAVEWSKQRTTFGKPISERQAIQWMLVDVYITILALRRQMYRVAWGYDEGENINVMTSMIKYCAAEWGWMSIDKIMQIFGGLGETLEMPIAHWYHAIRHVRIGGGTSEMMKMNMAMAILQGETSWEA